VSELREPLHQPPNPEDLRRVPPANPTCARIRGLLRDFVDGDLGRDLRVEVEEHVHQCRVCAVELSRAEHERLMVCRAFAALAHGEPPLSPDFSDRVLQRLMDETSVEAAREAAEAAGKSTGNKSTDNPTGKPEEPARTRRGLGLGRLAQLEGAPHTVLVAGLLVLLCASIVFSCTMVGDREPDHSARLVVTEATRAYGFGNRRLEIGDGLRDLQGVWVGAGGTARLEWHDVSTLRQPAATLDVSGGGEVRLENGAPLLVNGKIGVVTSRPVEIPMADGSSLRLGVGEYVIEVPVDWLHGREKSPKSPFAELHVEVEVVRGHDAEIKRSVVGSTLVAAGQIGVYEGSSTVTYRPGSGGLAAAQGTVPERRSPVEGAPNQTNFQGVVVDRYGLPNRGASVDISFTSDGMQRHLTLVSEADGRFSETTDCTCDRPFAIIQVEPAEVRLDLGVTPPQAMPVTRLLDTVALASPLVLNLAAPLRGSVRDELNVARGDVCVLPCIVDELFGSVLPLMSGKTSTDDEGAFQIHRLPSRLPPHQHLAVLLLDPHLEATLVPVPQRGSELGPEWWTQSMTMVARQLHNVQLRGLPHNDTVEMLEEVPGLQGESAVVRRSVATNGDGRVNQFPKGGGRLWWRMGSIATPLVWEMIRDSSGRYRPSTTVPAQPRLTMFRGMVDIAGTNLQLVQSYRHQILGAGYTGSGPWAGQALLVVDSLGHAVADAQVFSLGATGPRGSVDPQFHGFTSAAGFFPLAGVAEGGHILVIGADGAAGQVTLGAGLGALIPVSLTPTGRVRLGANLRPTGAEASRILTLRFEFLGSTTAGMHPVAVRFACAAGDWEVGGLPPGQYRTVIGGTVYQVEVPAVGFVTVGS